MTKLQSNSRNEQGYILLAVMLLMTLMLIALSVELPRISQQIRRSKEEELIHRAEQYKMAIKRFVRKNGRYPASLEQLDNTNQIRYLRKHYKDPMTGKDEWRILHVGEVQLNAATGKLDDNDPNKKPLFPDQNKDKKDNNNNTNTTGPTSTQSSFGVGNAQFGGAGIMGVTSTSKEKSIKELNGKDHYNEWLFVYDPRLDTQKVPPNPTATPTPTPSPKP